ncbi:hypothetical protein RRG08_033163 [Elysia crispata]|uniref:Uncharacterized protein n=1 Tax=Elysia crispata TaxID=231223 RepID=A0AAE0YX65_9GAST|nr:hypothetical protein RRG08_033163 [Elysia crispata]
MGCLKTTLVSVPPDNILIYDKTNLSDGPGRKKCVFRREERLLISHLYTLCTDTLKTDRAMTLKVLPRVSSRQQNLLK